MLTQKRLKDILHYDPETGVFNWRVSAGNMRAGSDAGHYRNGYLVIKIFSTKYLGHRLAWLYVFGYLPEGYLDHINRNPSDNRITNLREVSASCNQRNANLSINNNSGVSGVYFSKQNSKWRVEITSYYKTYYIGVHSDLSEAVCHRLAAEQSLKWEGCDSSSTAYQYVEKMLGRL